MFLRRIFNVGFRGSTALELLLAYAELSVKSILHNPHKAMFLSWQIWAVNVA
jgi:hypothetical protein